MSSTSAHLNLLTPLSHSILDEELSGDLEFYSSSSSSTSSSELDTLKNNNLSPLNNLNITPRFITTNNPKFLTPSPNFNDMEKLSNVDHLLRAAQATAEKNSNSSTLGFQLPQTPLPIMESVAQSQLCDLSSIQLTNNGRTMNGQFAVPTSGIARRQPLARITSSPNTLQNQRIIMVARKSAPPPPPISPPQIESSPPPTKLARVISPIVANKSQIILPRATNTAATSTTTSTAQDEQHVSCNLCGQELSSKCLIQMCRRPNVQQQQQQQSGSGVGKIPCTQTTCRQCGQELTTKCLLSMCSNFKTVT